MVLDEPDSGNDKVLEVDGIDFKIEKGLLERAGTITISHVPCGYDVKCEASLDELRGHVKS